MSNNKSISGDVMQVLAHYIDAGSITIKQLATWAGCCDQTVHNYLGGASVPSWRTVNLWTQRLPHDVRLLVASAMIAGSGLVVDFPSDSDQRKDLMSEAVEVVALSSKLVEQVHTAGRDGRHDAGEMNSIRATAAELVRQTHDVMAGAEPRKSRA